jgi:hypothetical protein
MSIRIMSFAVPATVAGTLFAVVAGPVCGPLRRRVARAAMLATMLLAPALWGCKEKWTAAEHPGRDEELEASFFAGLDTPEIADVPEARSLRPCCIFANDVGVQVGSVPIPGYEVRSVIDVGDLGTHQYDHGTLSLQPAGGERLIANEGSGVLYTCRGGFIDVAHVRDNADRTLYLAAQIGRLAANGGTIPLVAEGAERRVVVRPLDVHLVHAYGLREVVTRLAEWLSFEASIWHEIATWYSWSSTPFSERPSAFSPEDLYSNLMGVNIAGEAIRRRESHTELEYNRAITGLLKDAMVKLGALPKDATRRAFQYVDGIWWDSTKRVPDNQLVRHRDFDSGPMVYPWKLPDAQPSAAVNAGRQEYGQWCQGDWDALGLSTPDGIDDVPFAQMATLEMRPQAVLLNNGFPPPKPGADAVTQADFPAIIAAITRAAEAELGAGVGSPKARPGETSRLRQ